MSEEYLPINEGIDHINIYSKSSLLLGRQLSNFCYSPFTCEEQRFASVEGYWYWLSTGECHDELRGLSGFPAKKQGKQYDKVHVENFNDRILNAIRCKLKQNRDILNDLVKCRLPLSHYYYFGEIEKPSIVRLPQYQWIVDEFLRIRELMWNKYGDH